jgi:hypothetical protein
MVGFCDDVGLDGSKTLTEALASLAQEIERVRGGTPRGIAIWVRSMLLDEMRLKGSSNFICRLKGMVDGLVAGSVVNHAANVSARLAPLCLPYGSWRDGRPNTGLAVRF